MTVVHVAGRETVPLLLYALSTCGWCKKTRALLDELGVAYDYIYVNDLEDTRKAEVRAEVAKWNSQCSFPTLIINGTECIVGYQEARIRALVQE